MTCLLCRVHYCQYFHLSKSVYVLCYSSTHFSKSWCSVILLLLWASCVTCFAGLMTVNTSTSLSLSMSFALIPPTSLSHGVLLLSMSFAIALGFRCDMACRVHFDVYQAILVNASTHFSRCLVLLFWPSCVTCTPGFIAMCTSIFLSMPSTSFPSHGVLPLAMHYSLFSIYISLCLSLYINLS